jgi:diguanylate cyclase (GGDEF)-like protein
VSVGLTEIQNAADPAGFGQDTGELFLLDGDLPVLQGEPWHILVTDDDEEVHRATEFALRKAEVDGRPLALIHAYSARQARDILARQRDIAVAMVDVVMETPDAGLQLVETIRKELGNTSVRIVLRTGQPGYAPELEVIRRYDINDYRTKGELTQNRLLTTLTAAIRAYAQIEAVQAANRGMETVARASHEIFKLRSTRDFSRILLTRVKELLGRPVDGLVCLQREPNAEGEAGLYVEHATGRYLQKLGSPVGQVLDVELLRAIQRCVAARTCLFEPLRTVMWLGNCGRDAVVVVDLDQSLSELERSLLEMYAASLGVGFENVDLIERLDFFAYHDPLTHLANRTRFINEIDQDLFREHTAPQGIAIIDIVRFSEINDSLGHRSGDSLLVAVAKRLRTALGPDTLLARLSADWFGAYGPLEVLDAQRIRAAFEAPFFVHGHALAIRLRMGIVRLDQCKGNAVELLRNASLAIRSVHDAGSEACGYFSAGMSEDARTRVGLLHALRAAIDFKRGLSLVYQPVVNVQSGRAVAVEALLRWRNDQGMDIPPARFVPLAESTGMINELGLWVLENALDQFIVWRAQGHSQLALSINVSPVQLRTPRFAERIVGLIRSAEINPSLLCLEIPEAISLENVEEILPQLLRLRAAGLRLILDDFGVGHASLPQLTHMAVDEVKLAADYARQLMRGGEEQRIALSVVDLARQCSQRLIIKGVETAEQMQCLLEADCSLMQGFHVARPMSPDQLAVWLTSQG